MSIGIRLHDTVGEDLSARAQNAKAQGFACTHLALTKVLGPGAMDPARQTRGYAKTILQALDGLDVAVLGCYLKLAEADEAQAARIRETYRGQLRLSRWLGSPVVGSETPDPEGFDPARTFSREKALLLRRRLEPILRDAQDLGAILALEPVATHILHDAKAARQLLDDMASPNLQIILDPVNLLTCETLPQADAVLAEAIDLIGADAAVLHVKDCLPEASGLRSVAVGQGRLDWRRVLRYIKAEKPGIDMTLENTAPDNAAAARLHVLHLLAEA